MKREKKVAILFVLCLISQIAYADVVQETLRGQEMIFARHYDEAVEMFKQVERDFPGSPSGSFGQMAAWQVRMFENLDFRFAAEYKEAEARFERTVLQMLKGNPNSWDLFVAGAGYGMRGFYYARDGRWFRALGSALRAVQLLKRIVFTDPAFIDAKLGIGMYDYWRSVMTKGLNFLPFFGDRRTDGISEVEAVASGGTYANDLARVNLAFMYTTERQYVKARGSVDDYLLRYPDNIILRQLSARLFFAAREYDKAIMEYKRIMDIDKNMTKSLYFMGVVSMHRPGGECAAKAHFKDFLATKPEKEWVTAAKEQIEELDHLKKHGKGKNR